MRALEAHWSKVAQVRRAIAAYAWLFRMAVRLETQAMENCGGARVDWEEKMAESGAVRCLRISRTVTFGEKTEVSAGRVCAQCRVVTPREQL